MRPITTASGFSGLNTVEDPVRIAFKRGAVSDLQVAVNVTIDQSYRTFKRKGTTLLQSGAYHSLYCDGGDCFVVQGDTLYQVAADSTLTVVRSGLRSGARMAFEQVADRTYYTNGFELGWVQGGISNTWQKGVYTGPDTSRQFEGPFPGNHLAFFFGKLLVAKDNVLWWSEPYNFGLFNMAESFVQFNTKIRMVKPVAGGCFVSTEKSTYFLGGNNPKAWTLMKVTTYPATEWSVAIDYIDGGDIEMDPGLYAIWASSEGAVLGTPGGQAVNLTKSKVIYPDEATNGFGCLVGYTYIHGME